MTSRIRRRKKREFSLGLSGNSQSIGGMIHEIASGEVIWSHSLSYADGIAQGFGLTDSFVSDGAGGWFWSPPMTAMGLDCLLGQAVQDVGREVIGEIVAISGGFHQHAAFVTNDQAKKVLFELDPALPLSAQIAAMLTSPVFPCWMHASAVSASEELAFAVGGDEQVAKITGSKATARFPASPLLQFAMANPGLFRASGQLLHSGSSLIPSLLCQYPVSLDRTEGSAWNLMDLSTEQWSPKMCRAIPGLRMQRLPILLDPLSFVGNVGPYCRQKFRFSRNCGVYSNSGDNIVSLLGNGVTVPGVIVLSLGTSWTLFDLMELAGYDPTLLGHVMLAWIGGFMRMTCQTNGGKSMREFRNGLGLGDDWRRFDQILHQSSIDPDRFVLPFAFDEGLGNRPRGITYVGIDAKDAKRVVPGVVNGLFANLQIASTGFIGNIAGKTILATGGGSVSKAVLQAAADMLQATVVPSVASDTVALGGSAGAAIAYSRRKNRRDNAAAIAERYAQHGAPIRPRAGTAGLSRRLRENFARALEK